jgi:hypothetical protein
MGPAAEIRAQVDAGNQSIIEAQNAVNQARAKVQDALTSYRSADTTKLSAPIQQLMNSERSLEEFLQVSHGVIEQANAYALVV